MPVIIDGTNGISGVDGSASTPAVQGTDTNTGMFFPAADTIAFAEGGTEVMRIDSSGNLRVGSSSTALNSINSTNTFGFKNRIINGAMNIWQRGTSSSTNASIISDRFFIYATSSITGSRSTDVPSGFQYSLSLNGSAYPQIYQRIESNNCVDLVGQTITISFWAKQTVGAGSNSIAYTLYSPTAVDNYTSVNTLGSGSWTGSSSWTYYTVSIANLPASAANGLQLLLYANVNGSSTILFTGVQLEKGSTATSFDYRPYGTELQLCQRYYFRIRGNGTAYAGVGSGITVTTTRANSLAVKFPVTMRTNPSFTVGSGGIYDGNVVAAISGSTLYAQSTTDTCSFDIACATVTAFRAATYGLSNTSDIFEASAEL